MVMMVHSCECFYFKGADLYFASRSDAAWVTLIDSACRASVPLFVIASAYLLFPLKVSLGGFFRRRLVRIGLPFIFFSLLYTWHAGEGGWWRLLFNFPDAAGHLWFLPMLCGVYILMPLLSPWAEKVTRSELRAWLLLWFATTLLPFAREAQGMLLGAPSYGVRHYIFGECPWNDFGALQYVSGFFGYMLLGLYAKRFGAERPSVGWALAALAVGYVIAAGIFWARIPGVAYPVHEPYAAAVELELSWRFCSFGVALTVLGYFMLVRRLDAASGALYTRLVRPFARASFGAYLVHMFLLPGVVGFMREAFSTPLAILLGALATYLLSMLLALLWQRIPYARALIGG